MKIEGSETARVTVRAGVETLLIHPAHAEASINRVRQIEAFFSAHLAASGDAFSHAHPAAGGDAQAFDRMRGEPSGEARGGYRVEKGMALIPIMGTLIPRGTFVGSGYGVTSYEGLRAELRRAATDPAVQRIALLIDSPGGYVSGVDATAAAIRSAAAAKPVTAFVQGMAASAAYWLASQADEIVATPLAEVGSIGVLQAHVDYSKVLEDIGIKITLLHAGAKKVDGNPYEPLSDSMKAELTTRLEALRSEFAQAVAQGREIEVSAVLATEADTYFGQAAMEQGLIDRIGMLDEELAVQTTPTGLLRMESEMTDKTFSQADLDTAVATARAESHAAGKTEGLKEGATAERTRIQAIMGGEEAKGREGLAAHFAYSTDMPASAAVGALTAAPKVEAKGAEKSLDAEMNSDVKPTVGADGGRREDQLSDAEKGAAIATLVLGKKKS